MSIKQKIINIISPLIGIMAQDETQRESVEKIITPNMAELSRTVAGEGAVLLENRLLPLKHNEKVSIFGRTQIDYFFTGYGSGGDVNAPYKVGLLEGLEHSEKLIVNPQLSSMYEEWVMNNPAKHGSWGKWPRSHPEMKLNEELVDDAYSFSDKAIVVIGRSSGEDRDCVLEKGSYYLNDEEKEMLELITAKFSDVVLLLNIGCIMDMSWIEPFKDKLGAVLIVWQGGMESGNAIAELLCGDIVPSGRLTSTIAKNYADYPSANSFGNKEYNNYTEDIYVGYRWFETFAKEKVLYPFGYGLSYTDFEVDIESISNTKDGWSFKIKMSNVGKYSAKNTVCIYLEKPCGLLGNPTRQLVGFAKSKTLAPSKAQLLTINVLKSQLSSYDETGVTGFKSSYVIEKGKYRFYLGADVSKATFAYEFTVSDNLQIEQLSEVLAPREPFEIAKAELVDNKYVANMQTVNTSTTNLRKKILDNLPPHTELTGDKGYKLLDVKEGKVSMDDFVAQLSLNELEAITRGDYLMNSPLGTKGNAGVFGGVLPSLQDKGIPAISTSDGPSGIRLFASCSLIPIGTLLACTFDTELIRKLHGIVGSEMKDRGSDVILSPGMNIQRNPLCGRNFEYYSEDPYLTGMLAAAVCEGIQSEGVSACPKHFACNNQELSRTTNDSRVSERALREIYLKGFEICVKKANPQNIMTSYNKINGVWGHYHYELCTVILREEWGYDGCVMTDWWMRHGVSLEFPNIKDNGYRIRSQVDILMPGGWRLKRSKPDNTLLKTYQKQDGITLGEIQRSAKNILNFAMKSEAFNKFTKEINDE